MIIRGIGAVGFVWLLMPVVPDAGPGPTGAGSAVSSPAGVPRCGSFHSVLSGEVISERTIGAVGILSTLREVLLERIESVRADLRAHEVRSDGFRSTLGGTISRMWVTAAMFTTDASSGKERRSVTIFERLPRDLPPPVLRATFPTHG
jgi:hypothetical protein